MKEHQGYSSLDIINNTSTQSEITETALFFRWQKGGLETARSVTDELLPALLLANQRLCDGVMRRLDETIKAAVNSDVF